MSKLSASLEDYLEIICNLLKTGDNVKAVEVAKKIIIELKKNKDQFNALLNSIDSGVTNA